MIEPAAQPLTLTTPQPSAGSFTVTIEGAAPHARRRTFRVTGPGRDGEGPLTREHVLPTTDQRAYLDMFAALAQAFGTREPLSRQATAEAPSEDEPALRPLLTEPLSPGILYGYGDPSVLRVTEGDESVWWLVVTSNDAPDAFPILSTRDLAEWRHEGFVFPRGESPPWALSGPDVSDFWAPELHRVNGEFWVCFAARQADRSLAVGLARSSRPGGPYTADATPLVGGGVIDPHLVFDRDGAPWLFWKRDDNDVWPRLLCELLHRRGGVEELFETEPDRRTARLVQTLWPWASTLEPMEQFFALQPLIEAVTAEFFSFRGRLGRRAEAAEIHEAMKTRIHAQKLAPDGGALVGERITVLENDQPWEAHLIEGVWVSEHEGRYHLFYAGNDFSTPHYGIGVAVADTLQGPYRKAPGPLLRTTRSWSGPGHPSVAAGPDGRPQLFLHAFFPGEAAYKAFRALLTAPLRFERDGVRLGD